MTDDLTLTPCETPEPWKTALALIKDARYAEAHDLIEREVPVVTPEQADQILAWLRPHRVTS